MSGLGEWTNSVKFRDLIRKVCMKVLDKERPKYVYAVVQSVDTASRTAWVLYPGDVEPVTVPYGMIAVPEGAGQVVRIDGLPGDRFIADVLTPYQP